MIDLQVAEPRRRFVADIVVTSESGSPVAVVEVKNRPGMTGEIATSVRRNLVVHNLASPNVPYFLVVSQERGWLWTQHPALPDEPPAMSFSMSPVMRHYATWLRPEERLSGGSLEFVVANWLSDLSLERGPDLGEAAPLLAESGFLESVKGAEVTMNVRA